MKIITIGREFGSGGRELGKKLAAKLGYAYYDSEIVSEIAKKTSLSEEYVSRVLEKRPKPVYPVGYGTTFYMTFNPHFNLSNSIYTEQSNIISDMAKRMPCVIVGRCADYILKNEDILRVFVYSDTETKLERCKKYAPENENLSDKELLSKISSVDKERGKYYRFFTGQKWGEKENYDICINTSLIPIDKAVDFLAAIALGEQNR